MNYYAAQALYARILMWEGTPEAKGKALTVAEDLIENAYYSWAYENSVMVKNNEWWKSDLLFKNEHLFTIAVEKLEESQTHTQGTRNWFDASSPGNTYQVVYLNQSKAKEIRFRRYRSEILRRFCAVFPQRPYRAGGCQLCH